ncbi:hypothetical protein RJT34_26276 [Clitoria ternatea]|uniref:Uncharacterized protein n=1 Tax=Clitoria ternatea TaxID=43366 RepID=A0AAN9F715_CLITE
MAQIFDSLNLPVAQKYRNSLKKVAEKGVVERLSDRALSSRLSESMRKDLQTTTQGLHVPVQQHLRNADCCYAFKPCFNWVQDDMNLLKEVALAFKAR